MRQAHRFVIPQRGCPKNRTGGLNDGNGHRIIEIDYTTGTERDVDRFATPAELWQRLTAATALPDPATPHLLEPFNLVSGKVPRYYQQIAINRVIEAILLGQKRVLATLATGTGKTCVAFQLCWKLWNSRWNRTGEYRRPKILYLADRNILVDDPRWQRFTATDTPYAGYCLLPKAPKMHARA